MTTGLESVLCIRAFGSRIRGDHDDISDRDILIVLRESERPNDPDAIVSAVADALGEKIDAAIYSERHLRTLFREGHLFAWHLWRESMAVGGASPTFIEEIGPPAPNQDAADEVHDLRLLMSCFYPESTTETLIYDAGILYVIIRNVATSATWFCGPQNLDFSRRSPWALHAAGGPTPPLSEADYRQLVQARKATTAGLPPPQITPSQLDAWRSASLSWLDAVVVYIDRLVPRIDTDAFLLEIGKEPSE